MFPLQPAILFTQTGMQEVLLDILAVPFSVVDERTKALGVVAGPGSMRTAQISTCPMPSLVVYIVNSYPQICQLYD